MTSKCISKFSRGISTILIICFSTLSMIAPAQADVITTEELYTQINIESKRSEIQTVLARDEVRGSLLDLGVSPDDVDSRIDSLTDQEVLDMHGKLDKLPAGEGTVELVIGVLVIFMLLDIAGVTDIFPAI